MSKAWVGLDAAAGTDFAALGVPVEPESRLLGARSLDSTSSFREELNSVI